MYTISDIIYITIGSNIIYKIHVSIYSSKEAIKKYKITPKTSIEVVTKGPVAIAGSNFTLYNSIGTTDATAHAINIDKNIENPTVKPNCIGSVVMENQFELAIIAPNKPNNEP